MTTHRSTHRTTRRTMPGTITARGGLALSTALVILGAAGCTADDAGSPDASASDASATGEETDRTDGGETGAAESPGSEQAMLTVETIGQGPYGLVTSETPEGETQDVSGKLIIGPGSHMALTQDDQPQLLVFGEDAEFTLREDRPSVTAPELGTLEVGQQVELSVVEVPRDAVSGLPEHRADGADDTLLGVTG